MDTEELIDRIMFDCEGLDPASSIDGRRKAKRNLTMVIVDAETQRDFDFRLLTDSVSVVAGDHSLLLPTTFMVFGKFGAVALGQNKPYIEEQSLNVLNRYLLEQPDRTGTPVFWALAGMDADTGQRMLKFWPRADTAYNFSLAFMRKPPVPHDGGDIEDVLEDELFLFPETWHDLVLYEGTVWRQMKDKANVQSSAEQRGIYEDGKKRMIIQEAVLKSKPQTIAGWGSRILGRGRP